MAVTVLSYDGTGNANDFIFKNKEKTSKNTFTDALLQILYPNNQASTQNPTIGDVLIESRKKMMEVKIKPIISSSEKIDLSKPFNIVPDSFGGTVRAVIIGIDNGDKDERSKHDSDKMNNYLIQGCGLDVMNIMMLVDDGAHVEPTKDNILNALRNLLLQCNNGDLGFVYFTENERCTNKKDAFIPSGCKSSDFISSDDIRNCLTLENATNETLVICVIDCASGEVPTTAYSENLTYTYSDNDALKAEVSSKQNEKSSTENNEANKIESKEVFFPAAVVFDDSDSELMEKLTEDDFDPTEDELHPAELHTDSDTCQNIGLFCLAFDIEVLLLCCAGLALSCV